MRVSICCAVEWRFVRFFWIASNHTLYFSRRWLSSPPRVVPSPLNCGTKAAVRFARIEEQIVDRNNFYVLLHWILHKKYITFIFVCSLLFSSVSIFCTRSILFKLRRLIHCFRGEKNKHELSKWQWQSGSRCVYSDGFAKSRKLFLWWHC